VEKNKTATKKIIEMFNTGDLSEVNSLDILRFVNGQAVEHWGAEAWTSETPAGERTKSS
jgi:predicted SnoaL-like aldol condensation-catalyzing enzyme